jgi:hypothetical protein
VSIPNNIIIADIGRINWVFFILPSSSLKNYKCTTYIYLGYSVFLWTLPYRTPLRPYSFEGFVDPHNKAILGISLVLVVVLFLAIVQSAVEFRISPNTGENNFGPLQL